MFWTANHFQQLDNDKTTPPIPTSHLFPHLLTHWFGTKTYQLIYTKCNSTDKTLSKRKRCAGFIHKKIRLKQKCWSRISTVIESFCFCNGQKTTSYFKIIFRKYAGLIEPIEFAKIKMVPGQLQLSKKFTASNHPMWSHLTISLCHFRVAWFITIKQIIFQP